MYIATFNLGALRPQPHPDQAGMHRAADAVVAPQEAASAGGWFGSSLDLRRGLEVRDLGPADWLNECEGALAAA